MELASNPAVLAGLGVIVGFTGTLVGIGGGFLLIPYFSLVLKMGPANTAATSLGIIVFNSLSGSIRWAIQKRIDFLVGVGFGLATIPGTIFGRDLALKIDPHSFKIAFAGIVGIAAAFLLKRSKGEPMGLPLFRRGLKRSFTDATGTTYSYEINMWIGLGLSMVAGFISALFGIGGGWLHVPIMILLYGMPVHIAVATSQFVLLITSTAGVGGYLATDPKLLDMHRILIMGIGAVVGAQIGAWVATKTSGGRLQIVLAIVLIAVGASMLAGGLGWL